MSSPPYVLLYTSEAEDVIQQLTNKPQYATKLKKVRKALRLLEQMGPSYPGLHSHEYVSVPAPDGGKLWESYVEKKTPSAWRIWWFYGPRADHITVVTIGPHP